MSELDEFLDEENEATVEMTAESEATKLETGAVEADTSQGEKEAEPPAASVETKPSVDIEALQKELEQARNEANAFKAKALDERNKRQQLQEQPKTDLYDDPDKFRTEVLTETQKIALNERLNMSQMLLESQKTDAQERIQQFTEMMEKDPSLYNQMINSLNPYGFAYEQAVKAEKMQQFDNLDAYEKQLRAKWEAEQAEKVATIAKDKDVPPNLAAVQSSGSDTVVEDDSLKSLFPN